MSALDHDRRFCHFLNDFEIMLQALPPVVSVYLTGMIGFLFLFGYEIC